MAHVHFIITLKPGRPVDGESLLRGVANSMNKSSSEEGAATSYQRMPTRVLNPSSGNNVSNVQVEPESLNIAGKHDELLSEMTNDDRMKTMDALGIICNSIQADNTNTNVTPCKVSHVDPIVQSVVVPKSTSYVKAASAHSMDQPKVNSNFFPLVAEPVFEGVNISIPRKVVEKVSTHFEHGYFIGKKIAFLVVEYYAKNNWAKHGLKRIMMNSKGFFFFKFNTRVGLEAVLEGGPWLIRKSSIILKKWSMDTRLLKEELTRIPVWVKLSSFARCLIEVNFEVDLVDVVTIGIPSLTKDGCTKETILEYKWKPTMCDLCKIFGHNHDHCPKKVVTPPIVVTPTVEKTNDGFQMVEEKEERYEPKDTISAPKKGPSNVGNLSNSSSLLKNIGTSSNQDNITSSNSFSTLNVEDDEDEEHVENVYDETTNLLNTKTSEGSSFTAAVG
uniref:DUF4283 domain-containing protein n=1 Tax=Tanacetum cinerariifolium TaxID=118510 RepID=A0A6L2JVT6_TANCI|nr:hypothetical protein [Tanacetum cinerariifolium]